jgi:hypothetical protein
MLQPAAYIVGLSTMMVIRQLYLAGVKMGWFVLSSVEIMVFGLPNHKLSDKVGRGTTRLLSLKSIGGILVYLFSQEWAPRQAYALSSCLLKAYGGRFSLGNKDNMRCWTYCGEAKER